MCIRDREQHEFAEMVAEEAYRAGAKWVSMNWQDQAVSKLQYRHETLTQLSLSLIHI